MKTIKTISEMFPIERDTSILPLSDFEIKNFLNRGINIKVFLEFKRRFACLEIDDEKLFNLKKFEIDEMIYGQQDFSRVRAERLIRTIEFCMQGSIKFNNDEKFYRWLHKDNIALAGRQPIDFFYDDLYILVPTKVLIICQMH